MENGEEILLRFKTKDAPPQLGISFMRKSSDGLVVAGGIEHGDRTNQEDHRRFNDKIIEINSIDIRNETFDRAQEIFNAEVQKEEVCLKILRKCETEHELKAGYRHSKVVSPNELCRDSGVYETDPESENHRNTRVSPNVQTNGSRNLYPDQNRLNELYKEHGKHSKEIIDHCDRICSLIKGKHKSIVDVWAAVKDNTENIEFVIIVNDKNVNLADYVGYKFIQREKGDVSQEGSDLIYNKAHNDWWAKVSKTERNKLKNAINTHNGKLMRNHRYLTMISASPVRSKGYNTHMPTIEPGACISLYVLMKGYIPIQETQFEKEYDGIPVDVREGCFSLFTGPNVRHESLKSGCQIQRKQLDSGEQLGIGTLGGFIDYHGFGTCGITCAHVLLHETEIKRLAPETEDEMDLDYETTGHFVYQPNCESQNNVVGKVVKAIYREGGGGESGVDIAVFQIEQRFPRLGEFPALDANNHLQYSYDSGKTADYSRLGSGTVYKFGAKSYFTEGSFVTDMATTSVRLYETYEAANPYKITLHNLLEVRARDDGSRFAEQGDSGALVFCKGENNGLNCVGVVEGGTSQGTCVVMPITSILKQLNLTALKSFENNRIEFKMEERLTQLRNSISRDVETRIEQTEISLLGATNVRISQTEHNLQGSIDRLLQAVQSVSDNLARFESNTNTRFQNLEANRNP